MKTWGIIAVVVALLIGSVLFTSIRAARRLDRIHKQIVHSRAQLGRALLRRSYAAVEVAHFLDPASEVLVVTAAQQALAAPEQLAADTLDAQFNSAGLNQNAELVEQEAHRRWLAESQLTQVLQQVIDAETREQILALHGGKEALSQLDQACTMVQMSRSFHNTHVTAARSLRRNYRFLRRLVTGWTKPVTTIDFADGSS